MTNIAIQLDSYMRTLDAGRAAALEKAVRAAIAESAQIALQTGSAPATMESIWTPEFLDQLRADWGDEPFERPLQPELEVREDW